MQWLNSNKFCWIFIFVMSAASSSSSASPEKTLPPNIPLLMQGLMKGDFAGPAGYANYAEHWYSGKMRLAYDQVRAALAPSTFQLLNWPAAFDGDTSEFRFLRGVLVDEQNRIRALHFQGGRWGSILAALEVFRLKGFPGTLTVHRLEFVRKQLQLVITDDERAALNWERLWFSRKRATAKIIVALEPYLDFFRGLPGFLTYTATFGGVGKNMALAYRDVQRALPKEVFGRLEWPDFHGALADFETQKAHLLVRNEINSDWFGSDGHYRYAAFFTHGKLDPAFDNALAILGPSLFAALRWSKQYAHTPEEIRKRLINSGQPASRYVGKQGYATYANDWHGGSMARAYQEVSNVLTAGEFSLFDWQNRFPGSTTAFRNLRETLVPDGQINLAYKNVEGYVRLADDRFKGSMTRAFASANGALTAAELMALEWNSPVDGTTVEWRNARALLAAGDGRVDREKWRGFHQGLHQATLEYVRTFQNHENPVAAYTKIRRLLRTCVSAEELDELDWQIPPSQRSRRPGSCRAFSRKAEGPT